ncbi:hypothetical protein [Mycolicibacterium sp. CBMA 226]|uniref:hypothetical protein n=1 Tax=Mycolicibacterium sp. CBMA 226 TaxID=2606611 RepID=UPI0012DBD2E7|nr:hypothetical protein [Mycolicibacterium sp. CBMA 226]MUL76451.1 hypothetical protein [Mycolicibacterium sp. CBMA 226]
MAEFSDNLLSHCDVVGLVQEELQVLLGGIFPVTFMSARNTVVFCRADRSPAVTGHFKDESLIELQPDASMAVDERAELVSLLSTASTERQEHVQTSTIFARQQLCGWWRYRDRFQLRPPPPEAPVPQYPFPGPNPVYVDMLSRVAEVPVLRAARLQMHRREIELLLNIFMRAPLIVVPFGGGDMWIVKGPPGRTSELRTPGYIAPGVGLTSATTLPSVAGQPAPTASDATYYSAPTNLVGDSLELPASMCRMFDAFYALGQAEKRRFLNACFWYRQGTLLRSASSATYPALITAVEAVLPNQPEVRDADRCSECHKAHASGPTQLFREFLERYAPPGTNKERKDLYRHRSKLAHGDVLLSDRMNMWGLSPQQWHDNNKEVMAQKVVQLALINWLLDTGGMDELNLVGSCD